MYGLSTTYWVVDLTSIVPLKRGLLPQLFLSEATVVVAGARLSTICLILNVRVRKRLSPRSNVHAY